MRTTSFSSFSNIAKFSNLVNEKDILPYQILCNHL